MPVQKSRVAVIGSGPAGLMAAWQLATRGIAVTIFEKKPSAARKFLVAGVSGLNVTFDAPIAEFPDFYSGPRERFATLFRIFSPADWIRFIHDLGIATFTGTSGRVFVEGLKAGPLLKAWTDSLKAMGVEFQLNRECVDFEGLTPSGVRLRFDNSEESIFAAAVFALGGGSYEPDEKPLRWPEIFKRRGVALREFTPSNAGVRLSWSAAFRTEAEGKPLKNVTLKTALGEKKGDLIVTAYGLEGTPVYHVGTEGAATLDLKPDLDLASLVKKLSVSKENLSPIRRAKKHLNLCEAALALLYHHGPEGKSDDLDAFAVTVKNFPLKILAKQDLDEAISSAGGVAFDEIDGDYQLVKHPGVFIAGEMLDWDAPTGGFLIQACVSQGGAAAQGVIKFVKC